MALSDAHRKRIEDYQRDVLKKMKEPDPKTIVDNITMIEALQYYYMQEFTGIKQRSWVIEYMKRNGYSAEDIRTVLNLEERFFANGHPYTSLMRLCILGYEANEKNVQRMKDKIAWYIAQKEEVKYIKAKTNDDAKKLLNDIKNRDFAGFIEEEIDNVILGKPREFFANEYIPLNNVAKPQVQYMLQHVIARIKYFEDTKKITDKEELESISHLTHSGKINKILAFLYDTKGMLEKNLSYGMVKQKVTVNTKVDPAKILKNFKYKFAGSLPSDRLIGSKNVIAYNVKYGTLFFYKAKDSDGMTVKGASLVNFNPDTSFCKRLAYKVKDKEAYIEQIKKLNLGQFLAKIEADSKEKYFTDSSPKPTGSFNTDTMIVAVIN